MDVVLFRGEKRSGNHLLINWIKSHYKSVYFRNDYFPNKPFLAAESDALLAKLETHEKDGYEVAIYSFEFPAAIQDDFAYLKQSRPCCTPFLIRDPLNWVSSYAIKHKTLEDGRKMLMEHKDGLWNAWRAAYAQWKIAEFPVNYNTFVRDIQYRKSVMARIGRPFNEARDSFTLNSLWFIPEVICPSSFDTQSVLNGEIKAKDMKVFERYKSMLEGIEIPDDIRSYAYEVDPLL